MDWLNESNEMVEQWLAYPNAAVKEWLEDPATAVKMLSITTSLVVYETSVQRHKLVSTAAALYHDSSPLASVAYLSDTLHNYVSKDMNAPPLATYAALTVAVSLTVLKPLAASEFLQFSKDMQNAHGTIAAMQYTEEVLRNKIKHLLEET